MSRAERRAYRRMMKNSDPYALPAAAGSRARAAGIQQRRPSRPPSAGSSGFWSRRMITWTVVGALLVGLLAFSLSWPSGMPAALYIGLAAAAGWVVLAVGVRAVLRRAPSPPAAR